MHSGNYKCKQAKNLVTSPLTKKQVDIVKCMNLLGSLGKIIIACKRTRTDQQLQLQMHGGKCQILARGP